MGSSRLRRFALVVLTSALTLDSLQAFAGGPEDPSVRCGVHLRDFSRFQVCFGDPDVGPPGADCDAFDFDASGIVDLADYASRTFVLRTRISVFPAQAKMTYSQHLDFHALVFESGSQAVNWSVRRVPGGEPGESLGSIDANGRYSPPSPSDLRAASEVIVEASRVGPVQASEFACVSLFGTVAAGPPVSLVLPGLGGSSGTPSNVTTALPLVSLVLPGSGDLDSPMNVTLARPPVALVLPAAGDLDSPMNVTLAMPPVALVLPGVSEPDVFPLNVTVANPPVSVEFDDPP